MSRDILPLRALPAADDELFSLIGRLCDGVATREDCALLDQRLADPDAVECYCAMLEIEASLQWWHTQLAHEACATLEAISDRAASPRPAAHAVRPEGPGDAAWQAVREGVTAAVSLARRVEIEPRRFSVTILVAAIVISGLLSLNGGWRASMTGLTGSAGVEISRPVDAIARIGAVDGVAWQKRAASRSAGQWLTEGARLDIARGLVEIAYMTGATVIVEGPASFEVSGLSAGKLDRGRLTATFNKPRSSFAIQTPTAIVTDRGTQFGVEVDERGATEVRVFQGLVELAAAGTRAGETVLQLAAGHAGEVDGRGRTVRVGSPAPKKFVTAVPAASRRRESLPYFWNDAAAATLYEDSLDCAASAPASQALQGSAPVARGGVGGVSWIAPANGWQLDPGSGGLAVTAAGAAFLPFRPKAGFVYRLSVEMDVRSGGSGWAALGFADQAAVERHVLDHAWMLQRHTTRLESHRTVGNPNQMFAGPGERGRLPGGDVLTGPHVRTIVLDTTGPQWRAFYLVGDTILGQCPIDGSARAITHVGLSVFPDTSAVLRNFSVRSFQPTVH